jgi:hypothetical protein
MTTDERLDQILKRLDGIDKYLLGFRSEVVQSLEIIDSRLATQAALYQSLDVRMSAFAKAALDMGAIATRLQTEQSRIARLVEPAA